MLVGSFVAGMLPLSFHLSDDKMRSISTFGVGLLVGTALMVIIPEGIDAVYSTAMTAALAGISPVGHHHRREENEDEEHSPAEGLHVRVGFALLSGFVLMFLVDQMNGGSSHPSSHSHTLSIDTELQGLTSLEPDNEEDEDLLTTPGTGRTAHSRNPSAQSTFSEATSPRLGPRRTSMNNPSPTLDPGSTSPKRFPLSPAPPRPSSFTLGLIVHAAFDGVALGASAHAPTLSLIVFFAIMLHKAPSAFGLCAVLLRENGMNRFMIRRHLLIFSLAAPVAALLTYAGLRWAVGLEPAVDTTSNGTGIEYWTGLGLLFSGGTFLYVAMHVMQDVMGHGTSNKWQTIWIVSGMFTPVLLGSFGHGH